MNLEQEATEFSKNVTSSYENLDDVVKVVSIVGFISGANSKWVQAEKIKAQIELLKNIHERDGETALWQIPIKQVNLELQLKELENGN